MPYWWMSLIWRTSTHGNRELLLQLPTLNARLAQQLAVLLLGHALAALLDDRAHVEPRLPSVVGTTWNGNDHTTRVRPRTRPMTPGNERQDYLGVMGPSAPVSYPASKYALRRY